jgi:tetratricopeptide (TPR) repeat protein
LRAASGDFDAAIKDYSSALAIAPQFVEAYVNRGQAKQSRQDWAGAISDYSEALRLKPEAGTYFARASAREIKGDLEGAIADYTRTLELDPNSAQAYVNRAAIETMLGKKIEADRDFESAFKIDPNLRAQYKEFIEKWRAKSKP